MSFKLLLNIIFKSLGWYAAVCFFMSVFSYLLQSNAHLAFETSFVSFAILLLAIGLYIAICYIFILRSNSVIEKFKLEKGFKSENIDNNISNKAILKIGLIILGGIAFVNNLPLLFLNLNIVLTFELFFGGGFYFRIELLKITMLIFTTLLLILKNEMISKVLVKFSQKD